MSNHTCKAFNKARETIVPNPGSIEAVANGCLCGQMDNSYGEGMGLIHSESGKPCFYRVANCPIHTDQWVKEFYHVDFQIKGTC